MVHQYKRLKKLAAFLRKLPKEHFDFDIVVKGPTTGIKNSKELDLIDRLQEIGKLANR